MLCQPFAKSGPRDHTDLCRNNDKNGEMPVANHLTTNDPSFASATGGAGCAGIPRIPLFFARNLLYQCMKNVRFDLSGPSVRRAVAVSGVVLLLGAMQ
jgi:hypothetical protein